MLTKYILFIHGVNTREAVSTITYADGIYSEIEKTLTSEKVCCKKVALYWGDIGAQEEADLLSQYKKSTNWNKMWCLNLRETLLMRFSGDLAIYISRYVGVQVVKRLRDQIVAQIHDFQEGDELHIVSHSLGTVILFDILFSSRWSQPNIPGYHEVLDIRNLIFGIEPGSEGGIKLSSLITMGSPIGLFTLVDMKPSATDEDIAHASKINTHDVTPKFESLIQNLHLAKGKKLPWVNFAHVADPVGTPLNPLIYNMIDPHKKYIHLEDVIVSFSGLQKFFLSFFRKTTFVMLFGGSAHVSYWENTKVARKISATMKG